MNDRSEDSGRPDNVVPMRAGARTAAQEFGAAHDRELLAILFTDLVDSTKLQSELGNAEAARLTELHRKIVRGELAKYEAREIEWAGDSCLAVFAKPSDAMAFALRMQAEHRRVRIGEPALPHVRVGVHLGEIVVKHGAAKDDVFGLQVSETARVMSAARGDQIYCTRPVLDNARNALRGATIEGVGPIVWLNHGLYELKGSDGPVEICEAGENDFAPLKPPMVNEKCRPLTATPSTPASRISNWWIRAAVVAAVCIAITLGVVFLRPGRSLRPDSDASYGVVAEVPREAHAAVRRLQMKLSPQLPIHYPQPVDTPLALSPDGTLLAYLAQTPNGDRLALQRFGDLEPQLFAKDQNADRPFFSPDGKWIGYLGKDEGWKVFRVPVAGGAPVHVVDVPMNLPAAWGEDGYVYYTPTFGSGIWRIPAFGGEPEEVTTPDKEGVTHAFPLPLPGGHGIVYTRATAPAVEAAQVEVLDYRTNETRVLVDNAGAFAYLPTGHLLYSQIGRLMAVRFDPGTLRLAGPRFDVTDVRMTDSEGAPTRLAVSKSGTLVYVPSDVEAQDSTVLSWLDTIGNERDVDLPPGIYFGPKISPDGRFAAFVRNQSNNEDIWIMDLARGIPTRLTDNVTMDDKPLWMPDNKRIIFRSDRSGRWALYLRSLSDPGDIRELVDSPNTPVWPKAVTADGSTLVYEFHSDIYAIEIDGSSGPKPLVKSRFQEWDAALSPDDRWLAYSSNESGRREIYIRSYPDMGSRVQVSREGGRYPHWTREGRLRFTVPGPPRRIVEVEFQEETPVSVSEPRTVVRLPQLHFGSEMSMYPDGTRYLSTRTLGTDTLRVGGTEVIVVENWFEEIKRNEPLEMN